MKFELGGAVSDRSVKLLLIVAVVGVALFTAFQLIGILSGQENVDAKKQELAEASLMSRLQEPLKTAARSIQDASKTSGETLPQPVIDKMKEVYAVKPTPENGKRSILTASANDLMARLGVNPRQAQFILENRAGVESVDDFSDRRRNLFDANADTIEPMILQKIAQIAGRSGIQKLDFVKVEQQTKVDKTQAVLVKPSPISIQDLAERRAAIREALESEHSAPLQEAAQRLIQLTRDDPSIRNSAEDNLESMMDNPNLSADKVAQLRLAHLASQPSKMRILDSLLRTHMQDGLSRIPPEPAPEPEPQTNGENEAENAAENEAENGNETEEENGSENAENNEEGGNENANGEEGGNENANGENETKTEADDAEADNVKEPSKPPAHPAPIKFGAYPYPRIPQIEPAAQKRLMETLRDNQAAWLSDDQLRYILDVKEEEPKPDNTDTEEGATENEDEGGGENAENEDEGGGENAENEDEGGGENAENEDEGGGENAETENEEENGAQETTDADPNESEEAANEENGGGANQNEGDNANGGDANQNENESDNGNGDGADQDENANGDNGNGEAKDEENGDSEANGDESGDDQNDGEDAQDESESGPPPFTHPDLEEIRAYHVKLIDTLWRISEAVDKPSPSKPIIYTAATEFRARLENLTRFVYQLEGEAPWMRISELNLTKHNEDGPTLLVRVTVKATIF